MLKGIGITEGCGIGQVLILSEPKLSLENPAQANPTVEEKRFEDAVIRFGSNNEKTVEHLRQTVGEKEAAIVIGHMQMLDDPYMSDEIKKQIRSGLSASQAVAKVCDSFAELFASSEEALTRERAADVKDIKNELLALIFGKEMPNLSHCAPDTVLCARELAPSVMATLDRTNICAILTEAGGETSHFAILARAMDIPTVIGIDGLLDTLCDGDTVIVHAAEGCVYDHPNEETLSSFRARQKTEAERSKELLAYRERPTLTADGRSVEAMGNIGSPEEAKVVLENGGDGVGLFRTEFLFMERTNAPDEAEQLEAYKKAVLLLKGKPLTVRTLDIGGDKPISYLSFPKEENPFLGFRAVRYCLANPAFFKCQLRAILRAGVYGTIRIMLPLVTTVEEIDQARALLEECKNELEAEKLPYSPHIPLGVMIETPAAAEIADILAKRADFFSIGTNDLTQYTLTVDRGNPKVSYLYSPFHPAVLRKIRRTIHAADTAHIPVGMCGEVAADRRLIPLLLGFGLNEFSTAARAVPSVKQTLSRWSKAEAEALAENALKLETEADVREYLEKAQKQ